MTQVNKYADRAAYAADEARLKTQSAVSFIENETATLYDGVNTVVDKPAAAIGDLAVYDKAAGIIRFIKSATIVEARIPTNLVPLAVVYARRGERLLVVSLDNATCNGAATFRWASPYEVALSGFNFAGGGTFTLRIGAVDHTFSYAAGATPADIAAVIAADLPNYGTDSYGGWTAEDAEDAVILTSNTYSEAYSNIVAASGCTMRRTPEDRKYQTTRTGLLMDGKSTEAVRRNNRTNMSLAGCNPERFLEYYSGRSSSKPGQKPGSSEIVCGKAFTEVDNPDLVAAYGTYRAYLLKEHMMQYPCAYGTILRDGKTNTGLVGRLRFTDIRGGSVPCYPAAAAALGYGVTVEGAATGLEPGGWWLPSVEEVFLLIRDRVVLSVYRERDPVNRTLWRLGKTPCYGSSFSLWTSSEYSFSHAFLYHSGAGYVHSHSKCVAGYVRPVSAL